MAKPSTDRRRNCVFVKNEMDNRQLFEQCKGERGNTYVSPNLW